MTQQRHRVHVSTVLASAGAAATVSALVVMIGVVGILLSDRSSPAASPAPTVVNLGAAQPGSATSAAAPATAGETPAAATTIDPPAPAQSPVASPVMPDAAAPATTTATTAPTSATPKPGALPANFRVTTDDPTAADLDNIIEFLVATPASDQAKAANLEGGMAAVIVPRTVYTLGIFRAPLGWKRVSGPLERQGNRITAHLTSGSAGRPTINTRIEFVKIDGNWRLSANSLCHGVKTVGLNIYCNR